MLFRWKVCVVFLFTFSYTIGSVSAQRLTSDDLVRAGVTRLSDLIELSDDWIGSSTEGFHWTIAPVGTSWQQSPQWTLFIDGLPINVQAFNQKALNDLPITISDICEVRFSSIPVVLHGMVAEGGAIEIQRCTPESGLSLDGHISAGNETGDPGPFRYTERRVENVDRTGPTVQAKIGAGASHWHLQVTAGADEHHATDPRIRPRVFQLYQGEKDARILSRLVNVESKVLNHQITAGTSRVEDLIFLPLMGREIPLDKTIRWIGASHAQSRYGYSLLSSSQDLRTRENPAAVTIDFFQRNIHARGYTVLSLPYASSIEVGATGMLSQIRYGTNQVRDQIESLRIYGQFHWDEFYGIQSKSLGALSLDAGSLGFEFFSHAWHPQSGFSIQTLIKHRSPESTINYAGWVKRGYHVDFPVARIPSQPLPRHASLYSTDLSWRSGNHLQFRFTGGWRRYVNHIISYTESHLDSTRIGLTAMTQIISTSGHVARIGFGAQMPISKKLALSASGVYMHTWSNQIPFKHEWPHRFLIGVRGEFQPNERFSIDMRLRFVGQSTWEQYREVALHNPKFYVASVPNAVYLHVTLQKRLWEDRLRISATMRNVLDHPYILHPAGARTRGLFQVAVSYAFTAKNIPLL
ncbi:MAG: hypothetical protein OXF06_06665 [Bacteroidetes bacterium]|nr:hypothetical protein [Bacteroidota bacterium]